MFKLNRSLVRHVGICVALLCLLSSCSVVMAARKSGTSLDTIQGCRTRGQFLSAGAAVISSERLASGGLVEVYQYQKEKGSAARALMHGVLDVSTCGLWEVVGTPIEVCVDENGCFALKVYYDCYENVEKVEML